MSGLPWFELDTDMPGDPKCRALAARLRNREAVAYVVRLYAYCYKHATAGFPLETAPETIEDACEWRGKPGALFDALMACGFLDVAAAVEVHGVAARLAPHLAKVERDRERSRERRANVARIPPGRREDAAGDSDKDRDRDRSTSGGTDQRAFPNLERLAAALTEKWEAPKPVALPASRLREPLEHAIGVLGQEQAVELYHSDAVEAFKSKRLDAPPSSLGFSAEKAIQAAQTRRASA